jgi:hypothetical protein
LLAYKYDYLRMFGSEDNQGSVIDRCGRCDRRRLMLGAHSNSNVIYKADTLDSSNCKKNYANLKNIFTSK